MFSFISNCSRTIFVRISAAIFFVCYNKNMLMQVRQGYIMASVIYQ